MVAISTLKRDGTTIGWVYLDERGVTHVQLNASADERARMWASGGAAFVRGTVYVMHRALPSGLHLSACIPPRENGRP